MGWGFGLLGFSRGLRGVASSYKSMEIDLKWEFKHGNSKMGMCRAPFDNDKHFGKAGDGR